MVNVCDSCFILNFNIFLLTVIMIATHMNTHSLLDIIFSTTKAILRFLVKPFRWFKQTRRRNKVYTVLALVIFLPLLIGQISAYFAPPPYELQTAKIGTIEEVVVETGNINAGGRVDIYSTTTGIIEEVYVKNGEHVTVDQALFRVRSTATEPEKANAYAVYLNAVNNQKLAEQGREFADAQMWGAQKARLDAMETQKELIEDVNPNKYNDMEKRSVSASETRSEKDFRANEKKFKESGYAISAAQGQVNATWLAYQATQNAIIKATTNGTVANLSSENGDTVTAGASTGVMQSAGSTGSLGGGMPVLTIANLSSDYSIKVALNETDIPKIQEGQLANIILDAFPGKTFNGSVTHVDSIGTNSQGVITYNVLISIQNAPRGIKPGMTADVSIVVDKAEKVLTVPNSAVRPYKGGKAVRIPTADKKDFTFVPVEIGLKGETKTQIIKGLSEDQEVVTALANEKVERRGGLF